MRCAIWRFLSSDSMIEWKRLLMRMREQEDLHGKQKNHSGGGESTL